jgi:hypothetical protein
MHKNHLRHIHTQVNSFKLKFYKNFLTCKIEITHCTYAHLTKTIVTTWKVIHLSLSSNKIIMMLFLLMFSYPHYCITIQFFYQPKSLPYTIFQPEALLYSFKGLMWRHFFNLVRQLFHTFFST